MYEAFVDLDELIVQCRDKLSRKFIQEAVACYRAGAFRSCIVATWNAVVFDFLHKLRELELLGDKNALKLLEEFEKLSSEKKVKELWQFESDIPKRALIDFELVSNVEKSDIERLFEDRSRCAHPSMTSLEEPFEATAELARYHLRSAVMHLLQRPPVQGRAAKERIFQNIKSEYFPIDPERALKHFQSSPLARARFSLIKDIVLGLTVSLLTEDLPEEEKERQFSALIAVSNLHSRQTRDILNTHLSEIIINKVLDANWDKVIIYLGRIDFWDNLSEACQIKAKIFIENLDVFEFQHQSLNRISQQKFSILVKASHIAFLRESVTDKLRIPLNYLLAFKKISTDNLFKREIVIPLLHELAPQATLDELLAMRDNDSLEFGKTIESYLKEKFQLASLEKLASIMFDSQEKLLNNLIEPSLGKKIYSANLKELLTARWIYKSVEEPRKNILDLFDDSITKKIKEEIGNYSLKETISLLVKYEDSFFYSLIEPYLEGKISSESLEESLAAKSTYKSIEKPRETIFELFDRSISQQVENTIFENLLEQKRYWDDIPNDVLEPILKSNIPTTIKKFANSGSYDESGDYAELLIRIAEYLSAEQWEQILSSFFDNDQIYHSLSCKNRFEILFNKSLELHNSVQPYWHRFREKLNKFNNSYISLKRLIDSHL